MSKENNELTIKYTGPEKLDSDSTLTIVSVENNKVVFNVDDEDNCVIVGNDVIELLIAEGIVALLTKAVNREDGYDYLTGGLNGEGIETSSDTE